MIQLLAFTGKKYAGKNTAADGLEGWEQLAFANVMREMLSTLNPIVLGHYGDVSKVYRWDDAMVDGYSQAKQNPEFRRLMQVFGTDVIRKRDPEFWVRQLGKTVAKLKKLGVEKFVITDLRFDNEAEWVIQNGGSVVRVVRKSTEDNDTHASEAGVGGQYIYDTLWNDGDVNDLHALTRLLVARRWPNG